GRSHGRGVEPVTAPPAGHTARQAARMWRQSWRRHGAAPCAGEARMPPEGMMHAMVLHRPGQPLVRETRPLPAPGPGQVRLRVLACAVCRTDLHVVDGELPHPTLPVVPGHELVGEVETCGHCAYCAADRENLCDAPGFTGYTRDGGFATHAIADAAFCLPLPAEADPVHTAPLMCAGLIGWRALKAAGPGRDLGLYGFGAAAHLIAQVAIRQGRRVHAFTRPGDTQAQDFARSLGATWAGDSARPPDRPRDAAALVAPGAAAPSAAAGGLGPPARAAGGRGGRGGGGGIPMSGAPACPYGPLGGDRELLSVANPTRADGGEVLGLATREPLRVEATAYP